MTEQISCPIDQNEMSPQNHNGSMYFECDECSGHLLSIDGLLENEKIPELLPILSPTIQCPVCTDTMLVFHYKEVEIDICAQCSSVWLDPGELVKIAGIAKSSTESPISRFATELNDKGVITPIDVIDVVHAADVVVDVMAEGQKEIVSGAADAVADVVSTSADSVEVVSEGIGDIFGFILEALGSLGA